MFLRIGTDSLLTPMFTRTIANITRSKRVLNTVAVGKMDEDKNMSTDSLVVYQRLPARPQHSLSIKINAGID